MKEFKKLGLSWPPRGWNIFDHIEKVSGQSIAKDPQKAKVTGLAYRIEPLPYFRGKNAKAVAYNIEITGWEYTIHNESREYPVLSFLLKERPCKSAPREFYIADMKTMTMPLRITQRSAHRITMATNFLIKKINGGIVPDVERVLMLYKVHPAQRSLYDIDNARSDSLHCGLPYVAGDESKSETV